ncbi:MAG: AsmA family protein [Rhodocyclaceae bacterium]
MRLLKYVAFALGGFAALLAVTVAFLLATFDAPRVKAELARIVKEKKDRTLVIEGDLALSFWPRLSLDLGRTTLSERGSQKEFAALDQVRAAVALWPLVLRRVVVDEVRIDGVSATLIHSADGTFNFDDLLAKEEQESEIVRFDVAGIKLTNGHVVYRDEKAARTFDLTGVDIATGRLGNVAEGPVAATFNAASANPQLAASVKVSGRYRVDLDKRQYAVAGLRFNAAGDTGGLKALDLAVAAEKLEVRTDTGEFDLSQARCAINGSSGGDQFSLKAEVPTVTVAAGRSVAAPITLRAQWLGTQRQADVTLALASVEKVGTAMKIPEVKAEIDAKQGQLSVKGALSSALAADLSALAGELAGLSGEFALTHPDMAAKSVRVPVSGSLRADLAKSTFGAKLSARFDASTLNAQWDAPGAAPYGSAFDIDVDQIDVDRYFPPKPESAAASAPKEEPDAIDFSALRSLNMKGTVRIGNLKMRNVKASNLRFTVGAAGGQLDIAPLAANLYQGTVAGSVRLNAEGNRIALRQDLTGVSVQPLLNDAFARDLIEGRGNVSVDVATGGVNLAAMKRALQGTARVAVKNGALRGVDLPQIVRDPKVRGAAKQDLTYQASPSKKTDFADLSASFQITGGVAQNSDLLARSSLLRLTGEGSIDIPAASANYLFRASLVGAPPGLEAREFAMLKGVAMPVRATGPLDNLAYQVQVGELATGVAKAQVGARVSEAEAQLQRKARDELQRGLKGLLGG